MYACALPKSLSERSPVLVTLPAAYESPEENVVVATHPGIPLTEPRTNPPVPIPSFERMFVADA